MCTLKNEHVPPNGNTRGYMYPQTEIWVGMLVIKGRVFLGWTSTKLGLMCLAQGQNTSDPSETRTCGPLVSSQALYHWATVLPSRFVCFHSPRRDISDVLRIEDLLRGLLRKVRSLMTCSSSVVKDWSNEVSEKKKTNNYRLFHKSRILSL